MKRLIATGPIVTDEEAEGAMVIIQRQLDKHRVSRASNLPDEAKVRMCSDLARFYRGDYNPYTKLQRYAGAAWKAICWPSCSLWSRINGWIYRRFGE